MGHVWLIHRAQIPPDAAPGTRGRQQNWPLARVARGAEATSVRLPGVERVLTFTIELVDQRIADTNTIEHRGGGAPMEA